MGLSKIVIVDSTQNFIARQPLMNLCKKHRATYVHHPADVHSPSTVRNQGMMAAIATGASYALFVDVDVLGHRASVDRVRKDISDGLNFNWYPVMFTGPDDGIKRMKKWSNEPEDLYSGSLEQIGYATGIQLLSVEAWQELGGFDESFVGYGCEDIDMIHRATLLFGNRSPENSDSPYFEDFRTTELNNYRGYRKWMRDKKSSVPRSEMWVHFHHRKHTDSKYYKARKRNDILLDKKMRQFDMQIAQRK